MDNLGKEVGTEVVVTMMYDPYGIGAGPLMETSDIGCIFVAPNGTWAWERWDQSGRSADCYATYETALEAFIKDISSC